MKTNNPCAQVLLRLADAAAILETDPQNIRNWVKAGVVRPSIRGGRGRGLSTYFSVGQVVGLILAGGYRKSPRGALLPFLQERIEEYASWPWSALEGLLGLRTDDWTDEALAKAMAPAHVHIHPDGSSRPRDLTFIQYVHDCCSRLREAVRTHPVYIHGRSRGASK